MKLSPDQLASQVKAGKFAPVYYFSGDDDYRMQEGAQYLINAFLPEALRKSNTSRIDLSSSKVDALLDALSALPFFGERTALIVIDPQKLGPKQLEAVLGLLAPAVSERLVIFTSRASYKPKKPTVMIKKLGALACEVQFPRLNISKAGVKVARVFKEAEVTASAAVISEIVEIVGTDLGRLLSEAEKITAYVGPGSEVTIESARLLCSATSSKTVYQLVDRIVARDTAGALAALAPLLSAGESTSGILYLLGANYLDLYLIKGGRQLPPYKSWLAPKLESQARDVTLEDIERSISLIGRAEALLKGGVGDSRRQRGMVKSPKEALFDLTLQLCEMRRTHSASRAS